MVAAYLSAYDQTEQTFDGTRYCKASIFLVLLDFPYSVVQSKLARVVRVPYLVLRTV